MDWAEYEILTPAEKMERVVNRLREENARLRQRVEELERLEVTDVAGWAGRAEAAEAEVARLGGLIRRGWIEMDDSAYVDLQAEARRIRAQRGQSKAHESDCPCVMCDPLQVRLSQQLRAQRGDKS